MQRSASAQSVHFAAITLGCRSGARAVSSVCRNRPRVRARSQLSLPKSPSGESAQSAQSAAITLGCAHADAQSVQFAATTFWCARAVRENARAVRVDTERATARACQRDRAE